MLGGQRFDGVSALRRRALAVGAGALSAVLAATVVVAAPAQASVSTTRDITPRVNGTVYAVAQVGDRTIIAGDFTMVGGRVRNHVAAIRPDGKLDTSFDPDVDGTVYAVAGSADGSTVYLGGLFTTAGGAPRANLAAVEAATGDAVSGWRADTTGSTPEVLALASDGSRVYAGGRFGGIDGTGRKRVAALDANGDVVKSFDPRPNLAAVKFLATSPDGSRVFAGGAFDVIGGAARPSGVAELYADTGLATDFAPASVGSRVTAMGISPTADRLYFGVANNEVFAYDVASSTLLWKIKNGGDTQAIAATDTSVYYGGHFGQNLTQKTKRQWIAEVSASDGRLTGWDPKLGGGKMGVWALAVTENSLLVGGEFVYVNGENRPRFARFSGTP